MWRGQKMMVISANTWINKLLELHRVSRESYRECAQAVVDAKLKILFTALSDIHQEMLIELEGHAKAAAIKPKKMDNITAMARQWYVSLRNMLSKNDPEIIINEIALDEYKTATHYQQALSEDLPLSLRDVLRKQLALMINNLKIISVCEKNITLHDSNQYSSLAII
jgi:uncharacterized protein (TIGR02284 family)